MYEFSFKNYLKILEEIKKTQRLKDFAQVLDEREEEFIILRHDVEFSPKRALDLAKLEYGGGGNVQLFLPGF